MTNDLIEKVIDTLLEGMEGFRVDNDVVWFDDIKSVESNIKDSVKVNYKAGPSRIIPTSLSQDFMEWFTELSTNSERT